MLQFIPVIIQYSHQLTLGDIFPIIRLWYFKKGVSYANYQPILRNRNCNVFSGQRI